MIYVERSTTNQRKDAYSRLSISPLRQFLYEGYILTRTVPPFYSLLTSRKSLFLFRPKMTKLLVGDMF